MAIFSGDLSINLVNGGAESTMVDGDPLSDSGIENGIFASIFGAKKYFGNAWSQDPDTHFKSEFLEAVELPITIENLKQMSKAATLDLSWMVRQGIFKSMVVRCTNPQLAQINVEITAVSPTGDQITRNVLFSGPNWIQQIKFPAHEVYQDGL